MLVALLMLLLCCCCCCCCLSLASIPGCILTSRLCAFMDFSWQLRSPTPLLVPLLLRIPSWPCSTTGGLALMLRFLRASSFSRFASCSFFFSSMVFFGAFLDRWHLGSMRWIGQWCQVSSHWHLLLIALSWWWHVLQWTARNPSRVLSCIHSVS